MYKFKICLSWSMERICLVGSTTDHRYLQILRILSFSYVCGNYYDAYTVSFWYGCFVESQGRSSVLFLVLHGFGANIYVNNGLERRVPEMLEQPCAFDEQILKPYISSSLLLEVSQA